MTVLIIARHGNTFEDGETPRRIGVRTDIPLTEKGREQARVMGRWLAANKKIPSVIFRSELRRTRETAELAMDECGVAAPLRSEAMFNEIDYGPDENKTETEVIARIGAAAIKDWDEKAIVPPGWRVNSAKIINDWCSFGERIASDYQGRAILVVTSNGIARFAPHMTGEFESFRTKNSLKLSTGALCLLRHDRKKWIIGDWNIRPS